MPIHIYTQGKSASSDGELFGTLGAMIADIELHKLLGFALVRPLKSQKSAHIRFLHAHGPASHARQLLASVLKAAQAAGLRTLHTNDRADTAIWPAHGFERVKSNRRGSFVRWQLNIEAKS